MHTVCELPSGGSFFVLKKHKHPVILTNKDTIGILIYNKGRKWTMRLSAVMVPSAQAKHMQSKGISSVEDLISYLPRRYYDFTKETGLLPEDQVSCLFVKVNEIRLYETGRPMVRAACETRDGERVNILWYNQKWLHDKYAWTVGEIVCVAGKAVYNPDYNNYTIASPILFEPHLEKLRNIYPVYGKIPGVSDDMLRRSIDAGLHIPEMVSESLPDDIVWEYDLLPRQAMFQYLHMPRTFDEINLGRQRMLFDELLYFAIRQKLAADEMGTQSTLIPFNAEVCTQIVNSLPYRLTNDQLKALSDMMDTIRQGKRLNTILQGDVGSGKSIVAYLLSAFFASNGYQAVIMAPTQILALQHYTETEKLLEPYDIHVAYLSSSMKAAGKRRILSGISDGYYQVVIGTHAVLSDKVNFKNLALLVTDEEHKFGVRQREKLLKSAPEIHSLSMSATPIPRSLAQVIYGDMVDIETITEMPAGRKPVITGIATGREKIYNFIRNSVRKNHHQAYVVCPMIDDNEDMEGVKSASQIYKEFTEALSADGIRIDVLTGRDSQAKKDAVIGDFTAEDIDVLIATTIVEVGVNVPNANLMVIENAERFGLAQLHQLRGRVGRSNIQSYCVLETESDDDNALNRLNCLVETNNGFEISRFDLELRGAGDFLGTKQSGDNKYLKLMIAFPDDYVMAKEVAARIIGENKSCPLFTKAIQDSEEEIEE